jgi:hypothetical protein
MTEDARFEDADEGPLRLRALDPDDLVVVSAALQDAVFPVTEIVWQKSKRRFALLVNRFRWEAPGAERVQSLIAVEDAQSVRSQGFDASDKDLVLSLLAVEWSPGEDGAGRLTLVLAGDGAIEIAVEALEITLRDVTRPYRAVSGKTPGHGE